MTDKQRRFCEEYLIDCNATQAAMRAGYAASTASSVGAKNLKLPEVQDYLSARQAETREQTGVTREEIVLQLKKIGLSDIEPSEAKVTDKLKAMDMMIKLLGFDKQQGTEDFGGGVIILPEVTDDG